MPFFGASGHFAKRVEGGSGDNITYEEHGPCLGILLTIASLPPSQDRPFGYTATCSEFSLYGYVMGVHGSSGQRVYD